MGGKRPDQYRIDPGEAGATDYKERRTADPGIAEQQKQKVSQTRARDESALIPEGAENPALADLKAKREERAREAEDADAHGEER